MLIKKSIEILTKNARETQKFGERMSGEILKMPLKKKAIVLALVGNLGGGKTCFLQGFAKGLGIKEKILSPTFIIMKRFGTFYHFDCYRIQKAKDILDLGFKKIINNPKNIVAIEWADKIKSLLPKERIMIHFGLVGKNKRKIIFTK
ncbi:MAG: tRNA (adenosine(37)-N6)-threonylcarbamoyltransferase complex ATPase subunit type 1 TsaE [Candidatus Azambacteria bacterium]|nr:tRNA (adenosine(37)-N6)-threonylcarbamoyltransferase complex ATPase subunit type 1 TsaE [Candidatus Azambacteria bacterium]